MAERGDNYLNGRQGWENKFKPGLLRTNKRCAEYPEFCDKTDVQKEKWNEFADKVRYLNTQELWVANQAAQASACRQERAYDNIMGWCCKCKGRGPGDCDKWVPPIL
jgi:hypothetical protein